MLPNAQRKYAIVWGGTRYRRDAVRLAWQAVELLEVDSRGGTRATSFSMSLPSSPSEYPYTDTAVGSQRHAGRRPLTYYM